MELKQRLNGLANSEAITVTHLLFRYLTHRLDDRAFHRLVVAESPSADEEQAYKIALAAIHDIEAKEGSIIQGFSAPLLHSYLDQLTEFSKDLQPGPLDPALRKRAERELELIRAM